MTKSLITFMIIISIISCQQNQEKTKSLRREKISIDSVLTDNDMIMQNWYKNYLKVVLRKKHFNYIPKDGVIPDSRTAIEISEITLTNIYGKEVIHREEPFTALLQDGYWIVYGHLPEDSDGGVAVIIIKKETGEVINITHYK